MTDSIISNEKCCWICRKPCDLHRHHVYGGHGRRMISEREGCWVWLCWYHHTGSDYSVHNSRYLDLKLKQTCQRAWEVRNNGNREEFIRLFGRNYLDDPPETSGAE